MLAGSDPSAGGIAARAWCRADLAGGTLDIWPLGLIHRGSCTVNVALDLAVRVEMARSGHGYRISQGDSIVEANTLEDLAAIDESALVGLIALELDLPPVEVKIHSASPRGGGLGASSALAIAFIAAGEAVCGIGESSAHDRAALARDIEARLMELPTGCQDHFPALLGGVLEICHQPGGERVRQVAVDLAALGRSLLVVYTGQSHFSAGSNWRMIRRRLESDPETIRCFDGIRDAASEMAGAVERGEWGRAGELMSEEWFWRRQLAEGISTPAIEQLLAAAQESGAWGGKVCGAGGGGSVVLLCPPERRSDIAEALNAQGGQVLATGPAAGALKVEVLE